MYAAYLVKLFKLANSPKFDKIDKMRRINPPPRFRAAVIDA